MKKSKSIAATVAAALPAALLANIAALSQLKLAEDNPRANVDADENIPALADTIKHLGILTPLLVRDVTTHFEVLGGRRRLLAMQLLAEQGIIAADYSVPVRVIEGDVSTQQAAALVENIQRETMSVTQTWKAVSDLASKTKINANVAGTLGLTLREIPQMLALGTLPTEIHEMYEANDLSYGELCNLARIKDLTERDNIAQMVINGELQGWQIQRYLTGKAISVHHKKVRQVGINACIKAGAVLIEDLFDENTREINDSSIVDRLFDERMTALKAEMKEATWAGVDLDENWTHDAKYSRSFIANTAYDIPAADATEEEINQYWEQRTAEMVGLDIEDLERSDTVIVISYNSYIAYTLIKDSVEGEDDDGEQRPQVDPEDPNLAPRTLEHNPYEGRTGALAIAASKVGSRLLALDLIENPSTALSVFIAAGLGKMIAKGLRTATIKPRHSKYRYASATGLVDISFGEPKMSEYGEFGELFSTEWLQAAHDQFGLSEADIFTAIHALPHAEKMQLFAKIVAGSVNAVVHDAKSPNSQALLTAKALSNTMDFNPSNHWVPTVEFVSKLNREQLETALKEMNYDGVTTGLKKAGLIELVVDRAAETGWIPSICKLETLANPPKVVIEQAEAEETSATDEAVAA